MEYNEEVKELLESYHAKIESEVMPHLSEEFTKLYSNFVELIGKLKNKGLLKEDPYAKNSGVTELSLPDTEHFPDNESSWKVPERVSQYDAILSYITHNYVFSMNTFNFVELDKMKKFLDYYDWKDLMNPTVPDLNTQSLGKIAISFRSSTQDSLVIKTFDQCADQISKSIESIMSKLKFILLYLKESYKLFIRVDILPIVIQKHPDALESKILVLVCTEIKENYSYLKLIKKYITEVAKEEFSPEGNALKESVIKKLSITKKTEVKEKKEVKVDLTKDLVTLLMEIGKIRIHLAASIDKMFQNHNNLLQREGSFIGKLFKKLSSILFNVIPKTFYQLKITNKKGTSKNLSLHFEQFYQDIKKLEYELIEFAEEDKTLMFINKHQNITQRIDKIIITIKKDVNILVSLDSYLKVELKNKNAKAKGIKPELTVIKSLINNIASLYRDYLDNVDGA
ncbi:MAG: hypothetical protein OCD02_09795 [Spirochaetaceae bacterium]